MQLPYLSTNLHSNLPYKVLHRVCVYIIFVYIIDQEKSMAVRSCSFCILGDYETMKRFPGRPGAKVSAWARASNFGKEMIIMFQEEKLLEFNKIKEIWAEYAFTQSAKEQIEDTHPYLSELELRTNLRETTEGHMMIEKCGNPPAVSLDRIPAFLQVAAKGDCLGAAELSEFEKALASIKRLKNYLESGKKYEIALAFYEENLDPLEEIREAICGTIVNEQVADQATKLLKNLRSDIALSEEKMREKADAVIRANKECMSDSFSTFRNGHICIPVKKEYKFRISGSVIDQSSTGNTLFIEPVASARYYEELQRLRLEEENEVRRILYELTVLVDTHGDILRTNIRTIEKLDYIFSKAKLSLHYDGVEPTIMRERKIVLKDARHPLLDREICVPLQFSIGNDVTGIVITGPNTGGKTVALKTVALLCMMAQCGLHVPASHAEICMNSHILCDIGDGQNLSENLSTFSAHIVNVLDIIRRANRESLIIMDELGSGTDPLEGMGIAVAILQELKKSGALFLVTTHYPELKVYAEKEPGIVNARMTFDEESLKPLYQMVIGEAGKSCAFYIAKRLGMPQSMLESAIQAAYGQNAPEEYRLLAEASGERFSYTKERNDTHVRHIKTPKKRKEIAFHRGDSVMIYPDKKIGIVCTEANEKGVLQVQLPGKKIWINHKRIKLQVAAEELYPEDYDFSIIFDTVENRKLRHQMERKYVDGQMLVQEDGN